MSKTSRRIILILAAVLLLLAALGWSGWLILNRVVQKHSAIIDDPKLEAVSGAGFAGYWEGTLNVMGVQKLRMQLHIQKDAGGTLTGTAISPDQSSDPMPMTTCAETGARAEFAIKSVGGSFKGDFNTDGSRLTGHWKQGGVSFPLLLKRQPGPPKPPARPQTPQPPFPYEIREVTIENTAGNVTLAGTLTLPRNTRSRAIPAVILLTGSGPQDRDETIAGHKPFAVLADHLARQGIAVLRYDDRGTAKSTGDYARATTRDFANDAAAAFAFLKTQSAIDPERIGLCGHSAGATEAFMLAAENPGVAFVISLAGAGVRMDALLERQRADIARAAGMKIPEKTETMNRAIVALAREQGDTPEARAEAEKLLKKAGVPAGHTKGLLKSTFSPWLIDALRYDPAPTLAKVKCPVLALNGSKDTQVAADENLPALRAGLEAAGNTDITTTTLAGLNHLFQKCETGAPNEYGSIEETFNPDALAAISDWLDKRANHPAP